MLVFALQKTRGRLYNSIFMVSIEAFEEGAFLTRPPREIIHNNDPIPLVWNVCNGEGQHALAGIFQCRGF